MPVLLLFRLVPLTAAVTAASLLWQRQWRLMAMSIGLILTTSIMTRAVNASMAIYERELQYPLGLTLPGLRYFVNPFRLKVVRYLPEVVYGCLVYAYGLAGFFILHASAHPLQRAGFMLLAVVLAFDMPTRSALALCRRDAQMGMVLLAELNCVKLAFLSLAFVHTIFNLAWPVAAALLAGLSLAARWRLGAPAAQAFAVDSVARG
jgi:hypothetical protein